MALIDPTALPPMTKTWPEADGLKETETELWIGPVSIDRSEVYARRASSTWPRWRSGYSYPVTEQMRFEIVPFESPGGSAFAVILKVPEDSDEYFAAWVRGERHDEAQRWVESLNGELDKLRSLWAAAGYPGRNHS